MYLSDLLYKIVAVAIIVAFSLHHRVSGLVALIAVIAVFTFGTNSAAFKQTYNYANQTEGFTATIENSPILNAKNLIKDNVQKAKKMTESFFSR
jgi:hypothetical protein